MNSMPFLFMRADGDLQTGATFCTHDQATELLSSVAHFGVRLRLQAYEDKCFETGRWLDWGIVELFPNPPDTQEDTQPLLCQAIANGSWRWTTPAQSELLASLNECLPNLEGDKTTATLQALTETMQDTARRLGLLFPTFSLDALRDWPYQRPATWVLDTSSISQGAADFACLFLFPTVRLRIPSLVSVEILNMCDRFFASRHGSLSTPIRKANCLKEHLKSQGVQRALLRLEWHSAVEIERATVGNDPLRFVFQNDSDTEVKDLHLSKIQKSLGDRLIFETAKEHRSRLSPGQPVHIVTSDQGMARMAMGEGMSPVYFDARSTSQAVDRQLPGAVHHPFSDGLHCVSLIDLLWETASCFGAARLIVEGKEEVFLEAIALSSEVSWSPDHTKENLFFCRWNLPLVEQIPEEVILPSSDVETSEPLPIVESQHEPFTASVETINESRSQVATSQVATIPASVGGYIFKTEKLLRLIQDLAQSQLLTIERMGEFLNAKSSSATEYRRFLESGGFIEVKDKICVATPILHQLNTAIQDGNLEIMQQLFGQIPSYRFFLQFVAEQGRQIDWREKYPVRVGTITNYRNLAEICGQVLVIPNRGICFTPKMPTTNEFAETALMHYDKLAAQEWVETGKWLESLAWESGIHPVIARKELEVARQNEVLHRFFEGSTPDINFEDHVVHTLELEANQPVVKKYYLYRGDFLWSERPSVRIKLQKRAI